MLLTSKFTFFKSKFITKNRPYISKQYSIVQKIKWKPNNDKSQRFVIKEYRDYFVIQEYKKISETPWK